MQTCTSDADCVYNACRHPDTPVKAVAGTTVKCLQSSDFGEFNGEFFDTTGKPLVASHCYAEVGYEIDYASCEWIENDLNIAIEERASDAGSQVECIENVRQECPTATIANFATIANLPETGQCWCQWGDNMRPVADAGWENCFLKTFAVFAACPAKDEAISSPVGSSAVVNCEGFCPEGAEYDRASKTCHLCPVVLRLLRDFVGM